MRMYVSPSSIDISVPQGNFNVGGGGGVGDGGGGVGDGGGGVGDGGGASASQYSQRLDKSVV
tara:strand:- start:159 stop:344 length:186 start_codon:yes stop_codon:yes gene_type:complete